MDKEVIVKMSDVYAIPSSNLIPFRMKEFG